MKSERYYDKKYFKKYQSNIGAFAAIVFSKFYNKHININDTVLDFGCGGGFMLENIEAKRKIGVEINKYAIKILKEKEIECYSNLNSIDDFSVNIIIMHSVIGHLENPIEVLRTLKKKLKKNGYIILYLIHDKYNYDLKNDKNNIFFSFSKRNIRNISNLLELELTRSIHFKKKWPPKYEVIYGMLGLKLFEIISFFYGSIFKRKVTQSVYFLKSK